MISQNQQSIRFQTGFSSTKTQSQTLHDTANQSSNNYCGSLYRSQSFKPSRTISTSISEKPFQVPAELALACSIWLKIDKTKK
jgi:hypothetical protein